MDGYHYPNARLIDEQLQTSKGRIFTFNLEKLAHDLGTVRSSLGTSQALALRNLCCA